MNLIHRIKKAIVPTEDVYVVSTLSDPGWINAAVADWQDNVPIRVIRHYSPLCPTKVLVIPSTLSSIYDEYYDLLKCSVDNAERIDPKVSVLCGFTTHYASGDNYVILAEDGPDPVTSLKHEIGHVLGIAAHLEDGSLMAARLEGGARDVTDEDIAAYYRFRRGRLLAKP